MHHTTPEEDPGMGWDDWIELSHGRIFVLVFKPATSPEDIPRVWLEDHAPEPPEAGEVANTSDLGRIWLYPEDIPLLTRQLMAKYAEYRECAKKDALKQPRPNWGGLLAD
jgi:hypothetical protein